MKRLIAVFFVPCLILSVISELNRVQRQRVHTVIGADRKPAIEPRVYVVGKSDVGARGKIAYAYDYPLQPRHQQQHAPSRAESGDQ